MKYDYRIYATLLDSYRNFLESGDIWERFWGFSETPPFTLEEFRERQKKDLLDHINRVPFTSEAADRGTAFNDVVDMLSGALRPDETRTALETVDGRKGRMYQARFNGGAYLFPMQQTLDFASKYRGATAQLRVTAPMETAYGTVELYGVIDELMPLSIHDIKTTSSYRVGKFKNHHQHLVYPYCLRENGTNIDIFYYDVIEFSRYGDISGIYKEAYLFTPKRDIPELRYRVEDFIRFLEENRAEITDRKIFGGENDG